MSNSTSTRNSRSSIKAGDCHPLQGPSVYQGLLPSNGSSTPNSPAIPPLRSAHQPLLAKDGPALSSKAEVKRSKDSEEVYPVLLQMNRPGVYENAAAHYRCYASLQGREAPYCYGLFTFDLPDEPGCFGFVIEDISGLTTLGRWVDAVRSVDSAKPVVVLERRGETIPFTAKCLATLIRSQFFVQRRFAELAPEFATPLDDMVVLPSSTPQHIHFITGGWLIPEPLELIKDRHERQLAEFEESEGNSLMETTGMSKARCLEYMQLLWQFSHPISSNLCYTVEQYFRWQQNRENDDL